MRRTSVKTFLVSFIFLGLGMFTFNLGEQYYESTNPIRFSHDSGRPFNHWDYLAVSFFVLFISLLVVALMFLSKDE